MASDGLNVSSDTSDPGYISDTSISRASAPLKIDRNGGSQISSRFSASPAMLSTSWGSGPSVLSTNVDSEHGEGVEVPADGINTARSSISARSASAPGPDQSLPAASPQFQGSHTEEKPVGMESSHRSMLASAGQSSSSRSQSGRRQSRSRMPVSRRMSGATGTASPGSDRGGQLPIEHNLGVIGLCALDAKARSKPARNILNRINSKEQFEVIIFGDKIILDEEPENWPLCDYLISFFSDGFPLQKAIAYVKLRKPFTVNDLPMQTVLWDRRICLRILDKFQVPTPKRLEVVRDGGPKAESEEIAHHILERTGVKVPTGSGQTSDLIVPPPKSLEMLDEDTLAIDGKSLAKPFVEKPVNGEDHNIHIYYAGGGGRRLFRKVNNKSSEADETLNVPRCITDKQSSFIYEKFLSSHNFEDVKAYTVGPDYCHAETRKSPVVDGIVTRNRHGKEVRYVTSLTPEEQTMASKIAEAFGQRVCGFDLLRVGDKSYVIDVNGWSFVKDNNDYYDRCASILKELFVKEKLRKDGKATILDGENGLESGLPNRPSAGHFSTLKSILKSPSMSRLAGNHLHTTKVHDHPSQEIISQTVPMVNAPSTELAEARSPRTSSSVAKTQQTPITPVANGTQTAPPAAADDETSVSVPPPATKSQWKLKGMVMVIRHADRTPKQKFKFTFHTKPFVNLLKGHKEEVFLVGEEAISSVQDAVAIAFKEGIEDREKLEHLQMALAKKGRLPGTKVQIKPMFRSKDKNGNHEESPSEATPKSQRQGKDFIAAGAMGMSDSRMLEPQKRKDSIGDVTLSRAAAADENLDIEKLQLIVKWGGEPTHSARYQSQELGENMRNDLLLMNKDILDDLEVFSSSERRVTTSAQIWTSAFLNVTDVAPDYVQIRKDLLDDSNAAKDEMDKVKKKLKGLLRKGNPAPAQFAWPENMPEPYIVARSAVDLMKFHRQVMRENFAKLDVGSSSLSSSAEQAGTLKPADIQSRWCSGEDATLFKERWEKLFNEFCDSEKIDPGKISELHDTIKFDALHNRPFLEWIFTPSQATYEEFYPSESSVKANGSDADETAARHRSESRASIPSEKTVERTGLAHRMWRKRPSVVDPTTLRTSASDPATQSYFNLFTGDARSRTKVNVRLEKLRELFLYSKILFDFIGPQEYGITDSEKLEIGLLTSLPLLRAIVNDLEDVQASESAKTRVYFTKESHIYTLLNCIIEGGIKTKIERNKIPELDYLSTICFELYESQNPTGDDETESFNYSIRITISPGCHTFEPLDVQLDSKHCIGFAQRRSLTAHGNYHEVIETLRAKFHTVKLPKSFVAINLSEKVPQDLEDQEPDGDGKVELPPDLAALRRLD